MARTTYVKSAQKTKDGRRPTCFTCNEPIEIGQSYAWNQPSRFSRKYSWHTSCKAPRPSVLESNEKRSTAMAAFEDAYDSLDALRTQEFEGEVDDKVQEFTDAVKSILETVAEGVREAAELWRESASNIEDGFGHSTSVSEEMEEHADTWEGVADEIEYIELDAEFDPEQYNDEDPFDDWVNAMVDALNDELGSKEGDLD